jgi:hypothetical protein
LLKFGFFLSSSDIDRHKMLELLLPMYEVLQHGVLIELAGIGKVYLVAQIIDWMADGQESNHLCSIRSPGTAIRPCRHCEVYGEDVGLETVAELFLMGRTHTELLRQYSEVLAIENAQLRYVLYCFDR